MPGQAPSTLTLSVESQLQLLAEGNAGAANELLAIAYQRLSHVARKYVRQNPHLGLETVDVLHPALLDLSTALKSVRPVNARAFFGLAGQKIRLVILDELRPAGRSASPLDDPLPDTGQASPDRRLMIRDLLDRIFATLNDEEREVLILFLLFDIPRAEVAQMLDVSEKTVSRRIRDLKIKIIDEFGTSVPW
ncbi:RNA polymerase sigma factor [Cyanobium sp. Cruz-8H5]|uniref:RNA polymerase sigma factor n=1 Tax=Cyanobium sp. Cruz-8H5 TaxID=2823712 RepID=UPI0020CF79D2|nr:sigma-70 family RNA polymerase sigma factor [Cyanobium sp. Cruz-8H5]MCP9861407.1 sigma-70 family RNA polymerase sigma factor [Cyanobium sp. Cruz-8H5]